MLFMKSFSLQLLALSIIPWKQDQRVSKSSRGVCEKNKWQVEIAHCLL